MEPATSSTFNAEAEQRGIKRGASLVFDTQETMGKVATKVANTAESAYHVAADTVYPQAQMVGDAVKAKAADALETVQDAANMIRVTTGPAIDSVKEKAAAAVETVKGATANAVETIKEASVAMKEKTSQTIDTMKETSAQTIETVKKNTAHAMEAAKEKTTQTMETMKEVSSQTLETARRNTAQTVELVKDLSKSAVQMGQEGVSYVKGVGEGLVGGANGTITPASTAPIPPPLPSAEITSTTETSPIIMQESGINIAKLEELSARISNKTMDARV